MNTHWSTSTALLLTLFINSPLLAQHQCEQPSNVTRLDSRSKRLFAIGSENDIKTAANARGFLKSLANYISRCQSGWEKDWNVSIFADRRFAAYKTELESRSPHDTREWADAYIGEYSRSDQKLTLHPMSAKAKKWMRVSTGNE